MLDNNHWWSTVSTILFFWGIIQQLRSTHHEKPTHITTLFPNAILLNHGVYPNWYLFLFMPLFYARWCPIGKSRLITNYGRIKILNCVETIELRLANLNTPLITTFSIHKSKDSSLAFRLWIFQFFVQVKSLVRQSSFAAKNPDNSLHEIHHLFTEKTSRWKTRRFLGSVGVPGFEPEPFGVAQHPLGLCGGRGHLGLSRGEHRWKNAFKGFYGFCCDIFFMFFFAISKKKTSSWFPIVLVVWIWIYLLLFVIDPEILMA